jgi:hypothetical protein
MRLSSPLICWGLYTFSCVGHVYHMMPHAGAGSKQPFFVSTFQKLATSFCCPSGAWHTTSRLADHSGPPTCGTHQALPPGPRVWPTNLAYPSDPPIWPIHLTNPVTYFSGPPIWLTPLDPPLVPPIWATSPGPPTLPPHLCNPPGPLTWPNFLTHLPVPCSVAAAA